MIILIDEEKAFDKIPTPVYDETLRKKKRKQIEQNFLLLIRSICKIPTANIMFSEIESSPSNKGRFSAYTIHIQHSAEKEK